MSIIDGGESWSAKNDSRHGYTRGSAMIDGGRFNTLSLGNWLTLAELVGVPAVPARYLGAMDGHELARIADRMDGIEDEDESPLAIVGINERLTELDGEGWLVRCDGVSGDAVKVAMDRGGGIVADRERTDGRGHITDRESGRRFLIIDDVRLDDCISEWPEADCPIWARPIIRPRMLKDNEGEGVHPAEWRVFIEDGEIVAISNYYPQASRPIDDLDESACDNVLLHATAILQLMKAANTIPHHPRFEGRADLDLNNIHCSLDFLEGEDGTVRLLEGGPPHLVNPPWGAYSCCFGSEKPSGIAWGLGLITGRRTLEKRLERMELIASANRSWPR